MKKTLIILIISTIIVYFILDKKLYYYGKNNFDIYNSLPLKIKPVFMYDFEGGFYLEDEYGFSLISKGINQYVGSERKFSIREIIKYGYTDKKLIVSVVDSTNKKYFIECIKNTSIKSNQDMIINVLDENAIVNIEDYKWIEINHEYFKKIEIIRDYILISLILLSCLTIYLRFKTRK